MHPVKKDGQENSCEQFPSKIKATFNVAGSAKGGLSKVPKEIACEQFPSKEVNDDQFF